MMSNFSFDNLYDVPSWFRVFRHNAERITEVEDSGWRNGEVNLQLTTEFFDRYFSKGQVIWEPFGGTGNVRSIDIGLARGIQMITQDISPSDPRVRKADSTEVGPNELVDGIVFHPPYFGSSPFSADGHDLSCLESADEYLTSLCKVANLGVDCLNNGGIICSVGRSYMYRGCRVNLDWWLASLFIGLGFDVDCLWSSIPDMAVILRRRV